MNSKELIERELRQMPPLSHYPNREKAFNFEESEVIKYIMDLCDCNMSDAIRFFKNAKNRKLIVFDTLSRTWQGNPGEQDNEQ